MKKKLSKREIVLLIALVVIILCVLWYKMIYEPVNSKIETYNRDREAEQTELTVLLPKIQQKNEMADAVEKIKASGIVEKIPAYDNSKELMVALNKVMTAAQSYEIDFGEADRDGYIFIHKINIVFTTDGYKQARQIIDKLAKETFVNQISDVTITTEKTYQNVENKDGDIVQKVNETTKVALTITFFEVDG